MQPLRTIERALALARERRHKTHGTVIILLRSGVYELAQPLRITHEDADTPKAPLRIAAYANEEVVLSGGTRLTLAWKPYRNGIYQAIVPRGTKTDQLFVNGRRQTLARYPNFDPSARYLNGTAADAISKERAQRWSNPKGGYIHALQQSLWGSLHYEIAGKDASGAIQYEGGWQIDRDQPMHKEYRFVENIFEELDEPGEWFLNENTSTLYFYPPTGMDLSSATVYVVRLKNLVQVGGRGKGRIRGVEFHGLTFRHTQRTFMETREPLLRSDWRIYRGGAFSLEEAEDVSIEDCFFDQLGGNAVFLSGYNRRVHLLGCRIEESGANGVCFVGRPEAVRNPLESYTQTLSIDALDHTQGPRSDAYPEDCSVEDCLIVATGRVEKQSAPVEIAMSRSITVRHCSIYGVPRAGINIGDGTWGGHLIEHCDVFDTVLETSDHGAFNSWGRDRWWKLKGVDPDTLVNSPLAALPALDAMLPTTLAHTRWACEHGWDIDLDDGSSNYRIEKNLCLCGGIKLREGFYRVCENNIMVNNTLHPHVWPQDSQDIFRKNIVFVPYRPVKLKSWGKEFDLNLLHHAGMNEAEPAIKLQKLSGQDAHSLEGDACFIDPQNGNFVLRHESPALRLGFQNLAMDGFGVRVAKLRALARTPEIARLLRVEPATLKTIRRKDETQWMGATVRNLVGLGEVSAFGSPGETGVVIERVPSGTPAALAGLTANDLLLGVQGASVADTGELLRRSDSWSVGQGIALSVLRRQQPLTLTLVTPRP
ncbi:MAG TPA: PDZ domain-containing protein [Acidobacteriaceae bacterium]